MMLLTSNIWLLFMISIPHGNPLTIQVNQHVIFGNGYGKAITSSTTVPPTATSNTPLITTRTSITTAPPTTTSTTTVPPPTTSSTTVPPTTPSTTTVPPTTTSTTTVPPSTTSSTTVPPTTASTTTVPPTTTSTTTVPPSTTISTTVPPTTASTTTVPPITTSTTTVPPTTASTTTVPPTTPSSTTVPPTTTSSTTVAPTTTSTTTVPPPTTSGTTVPPSTTSRITTPTTIPITSCQFRGATYSNGSEIIAGCGKFRCINGDIIVHPDLFRDECLGYYCIVASPINIWGFNDINYEWHDHCNYSLVQTGYTQDPEFAVYSQFTECGPIYDGEPSCLGDILIRDYSNTVLVDPSNMSIVYVNNEKYTLSNNFETLIIGEEETTLYRHSEATIVIVGASGLLIVIHSNQVDTYVLPSEVPSINGLCNPYIDRNGSSMNVAEFARSWRTSVQGSECVTSRQRSSKDSGFMDLCLGVKEETKQKNLQTCTDTVDEIASGLEKRLRKTRIDMCMKNLCVCNDQSECLKAIKRIVKNDVTTQWGSIMTFNRKK